MHCWTLQTCSDYSVMDVCGRCGSLLAPTRIPAPAAAALGSHPGTQALDAAGALHDRCVCQFLASSSSPNIMRSLSIFLQLCRPSTAVWTAVCQPAGQSRDAWMLVKASKEVCSRCGRVSAGRGSGGKMQCRLCGSTKDIERVALPYVFRCVLAG